MMMQEGKVWREWLKIFLIAFVLTGFIRHFFFAPIMVDGSSMLPTLHDRDKMIVNKIDYRFNDPERFDIIVFHASENRDFIKRIIGLPGEHIEVKNNVLLIDGEEVSEPFLVDDLGNSFSSIDLFEDFTLEELPGAYETIPEDEYLVLGDNRENSTDSRIIGLIPKAQIVGKTNLIIWPLNRWQTVSVDSTE